MGSHVAKALKKFLFLSRWTPDSSSSRIDLLRGIAIVGVMLVHSSQLREVNKIQSISDVLSWGQYGVELFFLISGFLMALLYSSQTGFRGGIFWKRRVARILPLWIIFSSIGLIGWLIDQRAIKGWGAYNELQLRFEENGNWVDNPLAAFLLTVVFLGWLSPAIWTATVPGGWSIQSEMAHYSLFAVFRKFSITGWLMLLVALGVVFASLKYFELVDPEGYSPLDAIFRTRLFVTAGFFLFGIWLYEIVFLSKRQRRQHWVGQILLFSVFAALSSYVGLPFGEFWKSVVFIGVAIVCAGFVENIKWLKGLLSLLGKYSYFLYFAHFFVLWGLNRYFVGPAYSRLIESGFSQQFAYGVLVAFVFSVAVWFGLIFAIPSWKFLERPLIRWARGTDSHAR